MVKLSLFVVVSSDHAKVRSLFFFDFFPALDGPDNFPRVSIFSDQWFGLEELGKLEILVPGSCLLTLQKLQEFLSLFAKYSCMRHGPETVFIPVLTAVVFQQLYPKNRFIYLGWPLENVERLRLLRSDSDGRKSLRYSERASNPCSTTSRLCFHEI